MPAIYQNMNKISYILHVLRKKLICIRAESWIRISACLYVKYNAAARKQLSQPGSV